MDAFRMLLKHGDLPDTFAPLLVEYDLRPNKELALLIWCLIARGVKDPRLTLTDFLRYGPIQAVESFIKKTDVKVAPEDLSLLLKMFLTRRAQGALHDIHTEETEAHMIELIDLMMSKQPERREYLFQP